MVSGFRRVRWMVNLTANPRLASAETGSADLVIGQVYDGAEHTWPVHQYWVVLEFTNEEKAMEA